MADSINCLNRKRRVFRLYERQRIVVASGQVCILPIDLRLKSIDQSSNELPKIKAGSLPNLHLIIYRRKTVAMESPKRLSPQ